MAMIVDRVLTRREAALGGMVPPPGADKAQHIVLFKSDEQPEAVEQPIIRVWVRRAWRAEYCWVGDRWTNTEAHYVAENFNRKMTHDR